MNSKSVHIYYTSPLEVLRSGLADFREHFISESCLIQLQFPFLPADFVALSFLLVF